jgi:antitoxin component YwqK of YwqJK toxin-antitoxin module
MRKILILLLIQSANVYCQETLKLDDIYTENNLTYKSSNDKLFSGKVERYKRKNHLVLELFFTEGILEKGYIIHQEK